LCLAFEVIDLPEDLPSHTAAVHKLAPLIQGRAQCSHLSGKSIYPS